HAGDGVDPLRVRPGIRGGRVQVRPALRLDCVRHGPHRRVAREHVGRAGWVFLRRPPLPRWRSYPPESEVDGWTVAPVRLNHLRSGCRVAISKTDGTDRIVQTTSSGDGSPPGPGR